jgi:UDP-N-acetylmuramoyl-L-alanyl-D-glutamate--2,6-diaminopimelate ligase
MYTAGKKQVKKIFPKSLRYTVANKVHFIEVFIANVRLGFPGKKLKVIGVTGTSGKSTTTAMLAHILQSAGKKTAYFSTTNAYWGGKERINASSLTTETPLNLYGRVKRVEAAADEYLVIESSAHAMVQNRLAFLSYKGAIFTNLSHDHLDYFGTMKTYAKAKQQLFTMVAKNNGYGIFNTSDDYAELMAEPIPLEKRFTFGIGSGQVQAKDIMQKDGKAHFVVMYGSERQKVALPLLGEYNVENALAAIACALQEGVSLEQTANAMSAFGGVKGRMERFEAPNGAQIVIDFAHTPDAFELVLSDLRKSTSGKLIAVFGGYGDRDKTIRAPFGEISSKYVDTIILTEDTVGSETVTVINEDIKKGLTNFKGSLEEIEAREEAIERALHLSEKGDTVALLGKGHEREIKRYPKNKPWDEIAILKEYLQRMK